MDFQCTELLEHGDPERKHFQGPKGGLRNSAGLGGIDDAKEGFVSPGSAIGVQIQTETSVAPEELRSRTKIQLAS